MQKTDLKIALLTTVIVLSYSVLAFLPDLRLHIPELMGLTAAIMMTAATAAYFGQAGNQLFSVRFILGVAALLRLLFLWRAPDLSDDIYRYVLDGLMTLSGNNPYAISPLEVPAFYPALADQAAQVNHPGYITIYPPAAQVVFAAGAFLGGVTGMKCLLAALDLGTCYVVIRLLDRMGRPRSYALLYAWHPLAVIEIAGSGHIDAAGLFFFLLAVLLLTRKPAGRPSENARSTMAGMCMTAAVLVKLFPLLFLPGMWFFVRKAQRPWFAAGMLAAAAALVLPFWPEVTNGVATLSAYLQRWEFSQFAFRMLRRFLGDDRTARLILTGVFLAVAAAIYAKMFLENRSPGPRPRFDLLFQALYGVSFAYLLTTPTLHPWYALYLAVLLPFAGGAAGLVLTWAVFLSYRVLILHYYTRQWIEDDLTSLLIFAALVSAVAAKWILSSVRKRDGQLPENRWINAP